MARMIVRTMQSWGAMWLALAWLCFYVVTAFWPASWWLDVRRVLVADGPADAEVIMVADRTIKRPFHATWAVIVRKQTETGWTIACTARGEGDYIPTAVLPDPLTLRWWTDGRCPSLGPGTYYLTTLWTIEGGALPDKLVQSVSNVFNIGAETAGR